MREGPQVRYQQGECMGRCCCNRTPTGCYRNKDIAHPRKVMLGDRTPPHHLKTNEASKVEEWNCIRLHWRRTRYSTPPQICVIESNKLIALRALVYWYVGMYTGTLVRT